MKTTTHAISTLVLLLIVPVLTTLVLGCTPQHSPKPDAFFPADEPGATSCVLETQAARGARSDATLCPAHFSNSALNALGRAKLDLMLKDRADTLPLTIYLDLPADDPRATHAVQTYLLDTGLLAPQFQTSFGPNPATLHPAAPALTKLPKTDNPSSQKSSNPNTPSTVQPDPTPDLSPLSNLLAPPRK